MRGLVPLLVLLFAAGSLPYAATSWMRIDTPHFVIFGEPGAGRAQEIAIELERFREAVDRLFGGRSAVPAGPTLVVVLRSQESLARYRNREGRTGPPVALSGFFSSRAGGNVIALAAGTGASRAVFHEYTHLVTSDHVRALPRWLVEGLAEYYSTFELADGGRTAIVGKLVPAHLRLLRDTPLLPARELLSADQYSPAYNEPARKRLFYAQSWALTHLLLAGRPRRAAELTSYARATARGDDPVAAWRAIFGNLDPPGAVAAYVDSGALRAYTFRFDTPVPVAAIQAGAASPADAAAVLGELLRHSGALDAASAQLERAAEVDSGAPLVRALLGSVRLEQGRVGEARTLFESARDSADPLARQRSASGLAALSAPEFPAGSAPHGAGGLDTEEPASLELLPPSAKPSEASQKSRGVLERVECAGHAVVLHVRTGDETLRFVSGSLSEISVASPAGGAPQSLTCGRRVPPSPVVITWRRNPTRSSLPDRIAVAIEFVAMPRP